MTTSKQGFRDCLRYKLQGDLNQLGLWGHEYVRYLGGEIGQEFQKRLSDSLDEGYELPNIQDLQPLIDKIIPYMIKSLAEPEACDLLVEVQQLETIIKFADKSNYARICLYLLKMSNYLLYEEGIKMLKGFIFFFKT
jgi:26S proteasome regulatory subunit N1